MTNINNNSGGQAGWQRQAVRNTNPQQPARQESTETPGKMQS